MRRVRFARVRRESPVPLLRGARDGSPGREAGSPSTLRQCRVPELGFSPKGRTALCGLTSTSSVKPNVGHVSPDFSALRRDAKDSQRPRLFVESPFRPECRQANHAPWPLRR